MNFSDDASDVYSWLLMNDDNLDTAAATSLAEDAKYFGECAHTRARTHTHTELYCTRFVHALSTHSTLALLACSTRFDDTVHETAFSSILLKHSTLPPGTYTTILHTRRPYY